MLRAMREPLKYVQGKNACLEFEKEMGYMGKRFLFVCSNSGYKAAHDMIEQSFEGKGDITVTTKSSAAFLLTARLTA